MISKTKIRPYRVFHGLVNYGTQSGLLAKGLREAGVDAFSLTCPDTFNRTTDRYLLQGHSPASKAIYSLKNYISRTACILKYDIFHFYFGTSLWPNQIDLRILKALNKPIVMEYLGLDIQEYGTSISKYKWTNIAGRLTPNEGKAHDTTIRQRADFERKMCGKRLVCAPVYSEFAEDAEILPLVVDVRNWENTPLPQFDGVFKVLHLPTHKGNKGTNHIAEAIERLTRDGYKIDFNIVQGVPHSSLHKLYSSCHIFVDQILGGWYGTASIEAMACGRPVIVSLRDEYRRLVPFGNELPAIDADPDNIYQTLKSLIDGGYGRLSEIGVASRKFIEDIHGIQPVVKKLISIYDELWHKSRNHLNS
jgi:glycosyltransferase involved in cell wall biosynthesis